MPNIRFNSNVISAQCIVMLNVLTVTDENHKGCIFPILPYIMFCDLSNAVKFVDIINVPEYLFAL